MLTLMLAVALLFVRPNVDFRAAETGRIRRHLATVEADLRIKDVSALSPAQRQARAKNLDVLHTYWVRGVFPVNTDFPDRHVPYFIDRYGTRCAMAYLIEQSGRGDIVHRIATTENNAYVRDLKDDAQLGAWLRENGLTAAEAARIQPTYGSPYADFTGRWEGTMTFGPHDSLTLRYVLTTNGNGRWTLTLPGHPPIETRVVALAGDSLITQSESVASILGSERFMTQLRAVLHYGGHTLTGSIEVRFPPPSGAVVRGKTRATLDCPGADSPAPVVAFVRRAGLPKVRCMTETAGGALLGGEGTVHQVTYRNEGHFQRYAARTALLWHGRVGWIMNDGMGIDSNTVGMFRARPNDTSLTTPAFLDAMTTLGLRLRWARTLLQDPNVPRFVPVALIAALHDTVDAPLAELLVSTPLVTRDPELLVDLVHLPVAPDSSYRRSDGGMVYVTAMTGFARAREAAELLLWRQSLVLIAAPGTPHDVLLTIATWHDRHAFSCPGRPSKREVFPVLEERASREGDTAVLAALARVKAPCL